MDFLCSVADVAGVICYSVKFLDVICVLVSFVSDSIIGRIEDSN
jgi:hypothetical protein